MREICQLIKSDELIYICIEIVFYLPLIPRVYDRFWQFHSAHLVPTRVRNSLNERDCSASRLNIF